MFEASIPVVQQVVALIDDARRAMIAPDRGDDWKAVIDLNLFADYVNDAAERYAKFIAKKGDVA